MRTANFALVRATAKMNSARERIRAFLQADLTSTRPRADGWGVFDAAFSKRLGQAGFIGMTWPTTFGGGGMSALERYVVVEEICAAGAPAAAHWFSDRQVGPCLLKFGTEKQRRELLPAMARGECFFSIGLSEPNAGSDLASVRTTATRTDAGWKINGRKIWTSFAHQSHFILVLCRTGAGAKRHDGLSQIIVPTSAPGVTVRPIVNMAGAQEFNEVTFDDVTAPFDSLLGEEGQGWKQVMSELAFERSGPERFLSSFVLVEAILSEARARQDNPLFDLAASLAIELSPLRAMSLSVAQQLDEGATPNFEAALVKEVGSRIEQSVCDLLLALHDVEPDLQSSDALTQLLAETVLRSPSFSLRGGTREILRGIIAREMGLV